MDDQTASSICGLAKILWYDRHGAKSCSAIVFEQVAQTIRVSTTSSLPRFGRVRLTMGGLEYRARVESIRVGDQGNEAELTLQESRRFDERLPHQGQMQLEPTETEESGPITVQAVNYSSGGFQVSSYAPIAQDLLVRLSAGGIEYYGVIRYCHPRSEGFLIGIELVDEPLMGDD